MNALNVNDHQKQNCEGEDSDFSFDTSCSRHANCNCNPVLIARWLCFSLAGITTINCCYWFTLNTFCCLLLFQTACSSQPVQLQLLFFSSFIHNTI